MCIILACEKNNRPTAQVIEDCWRANPDGGGLMWADGSTVHGVKGLMTLDALTTELSYVPDDVPLVIHFRIGTSGGMDERVTHPYPVSPRLADLHATVWESPIGLAHNGVMHDVAIDTPNGVSDTVAYVRDIAAPLSTAFDLFSKTATKLLTDSSEGNRLCLLDASGRMNLTGRGWNKVTDGVMASNTSWKPYRPLTKWKSYPTIYDCTDYRETDLSTDCAKCASREYCYNYCPLCYEVALEFGYSAEEWDASIDGSAITYGKAC